MQGLLNTKWTVWLSYALDKKDQHNYGKNLIKAAEINNWQDFAYFWSHSPINQLEHYFANPTTGKYKQYTVQGQARKIQSINFFKNSIEPTWQYGDNKKGGYFNFSILKQSNQIQKIYKAVVFMAISNSLDLCQRINGVRFVDTSAKNQYQVRVQIWVDFKQQQNIDSLKVYAQQIDKFFTNAEISSKQLRFFNIDSEDKNKLIKESQSKQK